MSYKINVKTNATKFKSAPRNPLDIPTGPLDKPLTTGYEVFEWLKKLMLFLQLDINLEVGQEV